MTSRFASLEEAEGLLKTYEERYLLWLTNHLGVPALASNLILRFSTAVPPPVLLLEPDDLWFELSVGDESDEVDMPFVMRFVGRKKKHAKECDNA